MKRNEIPQYVLDRYDKYSVIEEFEENLIIKGDYEIDHFRNIQINEEIFEQYIIRDIRTTDGYDLLTKCITPVKEGYVYAPYIPIFLP